MIFFCSGLHHKSAKGINLIVLNYADPTGLSLPVNWRLYRKVDSKSKNDYFPDMTGEVFRWGLRPAWVTADSWYSSIENLKFLRNKEVGFLVGLEKNRIVSSAPHHYEQIGEAEIGEEGLYTHLKGFDYVKVFRTVDTDGHARHNALYGSESQPTATLDRATFKEVKQPHWHIEQTFRAVSNWLMPATSLSERQPQCKPICSACYGPCKNLRCGQKTRSFNPSTNSMTNSFSTFNSNS